MSGKVDEYNRRLVALSRQAAGGKALVGGDMAPTGKFIEPFGDYTFEMLVAVYTEQALALELAGVDLFVVETTMTMPRPGGAVLAIRSVSHKPVFVTFTVTRTGALSSGTDVLAALIVMQGMGVSAFGLNCSSGPDGMLEQLRRLTPYARVPLIAKPNAGLPHMEEGRAGRRRPAGEFALRQGHGRGGGARLRRLLRHHAGAHRRAEGGRGGGGLCRTARRGARP